MNKLERIATLYLTFLSNPGGLSFAKIREHLPGAYGGGDDEDREAARRKFERDKDELRALGLDLRYFAVNEKLPDGSTARDAVYVVAEEMQKLPELNLTEDEVRMLASILLGAVSEDAKASRHRELLRSAAFKLLYGYPALAQSFVDTIATDDGGVQDDATANEAIETLAVIHEALSRRRVLTIEYTDKTGRTESRDVAGRGLISHRGRWSLVAFCRRAQDIRMFYVDRIVSLHMHEETYAPDPAFQIQRYSLHPLAIYVEPARSVRLELAEDREETFLDFLNGVPESLNVRREGESVLNFQTTNPTALFSWMLRHPGAVTKLGPPELRERLAAHRENLQRRYASLQT